MTYQPTYWSHQGKYTELYDDLYARLVPAMGEADTEAGKVLQAISRIYYDLYNNGWGNGPFTSEWEMLEKYKSRIFDGMEDWRNWKRFEDWFLLYDLGGEINEDEFDDDMMALDDLVSGVVLLAQNLERGPQSASRKAAMRRRYARTEEEYLSDLMADASAAVREYKSTRRDLVDFQRAQKALVQLEEALQSIVPEENRLEEEAWEHLDALDEELARYSDGYPTSDIDYY
jgi:hypothetical protein